MSLSRAVAFGMTATMCAPNFGCRSRPSASETVVDSTHPGSPLALRYVAADPETKRGPNEPVNDLYLR